MSVVESDLQDIPVIDCDTHIIEPYDLWTSRVSKKHLDLVPHVVWSDEKQQDVWTMPGVPRVAAAAGSAMAGWKEYPPNRPPTLADADPTTWDVKRRLARMDADGIYAQVLYPNIAGFAGGNYLLVPSEEARLECVRAYNDWLMEWVEPAPDRFVANCAIPFWDVDASVAEMRRCRELGHRGLIFSNRPSDFGQPYLADPHWDPIWATAQELDLPVNFHIGSGGVGDFGTNNYAGNSEGLNYAIDSALIFQSNARAIVEVIYTGIADRFPDLKFVSVESGVGWLPFQLESMDWQWLATGQHKAFPDRKMPSEYFKRQFSVCFWFESAQAIKNVVDVLGPECVLFETDFPHPTSQSPGPASPAVEPQEYIANAFALLDPEASRLILHDNAARLYHIESVRG